MKTVTLNLIAVLFSLGIGSGQTASAQYPEKPVTVIVGYGAGGGADTVARLYADGLAREMGQSFIVDNRPGAGATLAAAAFAKAPPDGYTLMVAPTAVLAITPHARKVNYDPKTDFTPISILATGLDVVVGSKTLPANNLEELIALAKQNPGRYTYASSGIATWTHLMGEIFKEAAGIDLLHVPYKSSSEYVADLLEGRVSLSFDPVMINLVRGDKLKLLSFIAEERVEGYPDIGTSKEVGIDMRVAQNRLWYSLFAPAGAPDDVVQTLANAVEKIAQDQDIAAKIAATGIRPNSVSGAAFQAQYLNDIDYYGGLLKKLNVALEN